MLCWGGPLPITPSSSLCWVEHTGTMVIDKKQRPLRAFTYSTIIYNLEAANDLTWSVSEEILFWLLWSYREREIGGWDVDGGWCHWIMHVIINLENKTLQCFHRNSHLFHSLDNNIIGYLTSFEWNGSYTKNKITKVITGQDDPPLSLLLFSKKCIQGSCLQWVMTSFIALGWMDNK